MLSLRLYVYIIALHNNIKAGSSRGVINICVSGININSLYCLAFCLVFIPSSNSVALYLPVLFVKKINLWMKSIVLLLGYFVHILLLFCYVMHSSSLGILNTILNSLENVAIIL